MPYEISTFQLPCGATSIRAVGSGVIGKEDAEYVMRYVNGGDYTKLFTAEPEAIRWLDERALEDAAKKTATA